MRRDTKKKIRRERMIMIASSALVMGALTLTGIYMKDRSDRNVDDGYSVDFSALEDSVDGKVKEIAKNQQNHLVNQEAETDFLAEADPVTEDDLDYDPVAVDSDLVEIPGLTDKKTDDRFQEEEEEEDGEEEKEAEDTAGTVVNVSKELHFSQDQGLVRPLGGEILMHYSMDKSIYFATLDQYKYNPAVMLKASQGDVVKVCADAKVVSVFENEEIGKAVTLDLGDGYQAIYGQLADIRVSEGSYIDSGEVIGSVAAPTKYFSKEGANLYFQLSKDAEPVNPEGLFR